MPNLGSFIKEKRESKGISQKGLGSICGVSDSAIHNIEIGKTKNPSWELLCRIATPLEIHPLEIMKEAGYITESDIDPCFLIKGLEKLDKHDLEIVQHFIDFIIYRKSCGKTREEGCSNAI